MMTWQGLSPQALTAIQQIIPTRTTTLDIVVTCQAGAPGIQVVGDGQQARLTYGSRVDLLRGAVILVHEAQWQRAFTVTQRPQFETMAAMIDVARNGVPTVAMLKQTLRRLARMGYNELWLYLEDVFEIPEQPYFGQSRGRYQQAELHELAVYGDLLGVTVVPAVQTLAHLHNMLKWDAFAEIKDTDETLLVGAPATTTFLTQLLTAASAPFTTNKIHIGMDEAYQLGRGRYMDQHGFTKQQTLILAQLQLVVQLTKQLGLDPYMWSDLWFTFASKKHEMYDPDVHFTPAFKASLPPVGQVYWDYYHEDVATYQQRLQQHFELSDQVVFAGGLWTWSALAPNQSKMLATVKAGLTAAKTSGVKQVVATLWFDDGAEVPLSAAWYGLQTFAAYQYHDHVTAKVIATDYQIMQQESPTFYQLLDQFDNFTGDINRDADNVSKIVLYEDLLLQRYQQNLAALDLESQYSQLLAQLKMVKVAPAHQLMAQFYQQLATTVLIKARALSAIAQLGNQQPDPAVATNALTLIQHYQQAIEQLLTSYRQVWYQQRRGQGFEVIDQRLGGQLARCLTVRARIQAWAQGLDSLAELQAPRLPMDKHTNGLVGHGLYREIVSASDLSF
ncbi:beta-N-acetylhexosaminidase [Lactiplantibacillus daowaiensis]|uniref:Family 20 glycosylhydrolase n=1 Tax=Lactiplantibacillus daowaiensis TaxID=2559918 RepID=A0ABW1RZW5_9LACO|nr:beta-N-acetylhexosaminidase [Lactiplantibacillus daowaiensis]